MGKLKTAYKNMPLKKTLIVTIAASIVTAFVLAAIVAIITRPSYYNLISSNAGNTVLLLHDLVTFAIIGLCICASIVVGIFIFYKQKLSIPLQALMDGTEQIALDNLDFAIQYEARDELGTLCKSFDRMRDELQRNYMKMWRMTEERKKLNAAFAHDLRTPLTVLCGYTDFLNEYIPSPEKSDEKLLATNRTMAQYIRRLEDYVETMNTIQKLEDTPIKIQSLSMDDFMAMLSDNIKLTSKEYDKEFSISNETGLTDIQGDIPLIFRVLENVAGNAFQHAKSKVYICLFSHNNMLYFDVIDDGVGFTAKDLEQALNPFYTSEQSDDSHFGLGLSISKTLCENHGGGITLSNTKDLGAKVEVSFLMKK